MGRERPTFSITHSLGRRNLKVNDWVKSVRESTGVVLDREQKLRLQRNFFYDKSYILVREIRYSYINQVCRVK